jgi:hypothetical protein
MVRRREVPIGTDRRLRFTMELDRGRPRSWAVQLEWEDPEEERWVWVVRYDTAGGTPHRDRNRIAAHEPVDLPRDPGKAARVAETDLTEQAEEYIEAYRAAKAQGKEAW